MDRLSDDAINAALARGAANRASDPRAMLVRFDKKSGRLIVELSNDCTFTLPPKLIEGLENANDNQLANVEVLGAGYGLHWPDLDVDISVAGLLAGVFGDTLPYGPPCRPNEIRSQISSGTRERRKGRQTKKEHGIKKPAKDFHPSPAASPTQERLSVKPRGRGDGQPPALPLPVSAIQRRG